jgi:TPR repeat protein
MKAIRMRSVSKIPLSRPLCAVLAAVVLYSQHAAAETVAPVPTDSQLADVKCIIGMERYVPGDYFYCLASQTYGRQQFGNADRFFHEAASWGSKPAQFVLGVMALNGDHQPVNRPLAFAWLTLAAERGTERFQKLYQTVKQSLSAGELEESEKLLDGMRMYRDAVAMPRAERRYADGMASLHEKSMASNICMDGTLDFGALTGGSPDPDAAGASPALASKMGGACPTPAQLEEKINDVAANVFEDWHGHVSVGPLRQAPGK